MTADTDPWTRIEAAHALWAVTGDTNSTVPALIRAVPDGTIRTAVEALLTACEG